MIVYNYTYIYTSAYTYNYNRLHLSKICLRCFLEMHLYSKNLSTTATNSLLIMSELFPPCFSCNNNFNLLQSSSGFSDNNIVVTPEAIIAGDFSNFIRVLSRVDFLTYSFQIEVQFLRKIIH